MNRTRFAWIDPADGRWCHGGTINYRRKAGPRDAFKNSCSNSDNKFAKQQARIVERVLIEFARGEQRGTSVHSFLQACDCLGISKECDYFGLKYQNAKGEELWLNLRNPIERQTGGGVAPLRFALRVKFWVPPHLLLQEATR